MVYMQMAGHSFSCRTELAVAENSRFGRFHDMVLRYQQALLIHACQSVGCIAHHVIAQAYLVFHISLRQRLGGLFNLARERISSWVPARG